MYARIQPTVFVRADRLAMEKTLLTSHDQSLDHSDDSRGYSDVNFTLSSFKEAISVACVVRCARGDRP